MDRIRDGAARIAGERTGSSIALSPATPAPIPVAVRIDAPPQPAAGFGRPLRLVPLRRAVVRVPVRGASGSWLAHRLKRGLDLVGAGFGLVAAAPVIALAAVAIRLDSRGPVFFRQVRCGQDGRVFAMWKLRTMVADAEARKADLLDRNLMDGPVFKVRGDPRVTRIGRVLRRYSIDELPQLWNVITGQMSLVGPRPPLPNEVAQYGPFERKRLSVRPGLTCEWQVSGRNQIPFKEWVRLDVDYIENWSLSRDLWLLLRTIPAVLRGDGAI